ncbi:MAG TPA: metallophosphoesterase [Sandaracinaceae bacterium LLY-WYZ-13_1]|nr:metallophosphoesterase [Sandaracinaceae bacterium LLY-WYZ-13_1]
MRHAPTLLLPFLLAAACADPATTADPAPPDDPAEAPPEEPPTDPSAATASPLDRLDQPPPLDDAVTSELREALVGGADPSGFEGPPAFGAPGAELADRRPSGPVLSPSELDTRLFDEEPEPGETGPRATVNPRLFRTEPTAALAADGTVTVRFESTREVPAASVYFGGEVPEDPFAIARLRRRSTALSSRGRAHTLTFDVSPLLRRKYDVARVRERGRGVVRWRVEALDPEAGTARVYDGRTAFRCAETPCTPRTELVQLPTVRLGPFVDRVDHEGATISFETDVPTAALVAARAAGGPVRQVRSEGVGTRHELRLSGLSPDTRHRYHVLVVDQRGEVAQGRSATFETWPAPEDHESLTFALLSDSRSGLGAADEQYAGTNRQVLDDLLRRALARGAAFAVFAGDLIDGYRTHAGSVRYELEAWQRATEPVGALMPIYEGMGNHEALLEVWTPGWAIAQTGEASAESLFAERFVNPENAPAPAQGAPPYAEHVYSFDAGPAHLAMVNTNYFYRSHFHREDHPAHGRGQREGWIDDRQLAWLAEDLAAARERGARHLYVFTHEPGFPNGGHVADAMWWEGRFEEVLAQRRRFFALLAEHGVEAVFHGDEHNYSRTRVHDGLVEGLEEPLWQIISGGAGAPYYAQNRTVPWADDVVAFDARQHVVIVDIDGDAARARVVSRSGETVDAFDLTDAGQ